MPGFLSDWHVMERFRGVVKVAQELRAMNGTTGALIIRTGFWGI